MDFSDPQVHVCKDKTDFSDPQVHVCKDKMDFSDPQVTLHVCNYLLYITNHGNALNPFSSLKTSPLTDRCKCNDFLNTIF